MPTPLHHLRDDTNPILLEQRSLTRALLAAGWHPLGPGDPAPVNQAPTLCQIVTGQFATGLHRDTAGIIRAPCWALWWRLLPRAVRAPLAPALHPERAT